MPEEQPPGVRHRVPNLASSSTGGRLMMKVGHRRGVEGFIHIWHEEARNRSAMRHASVDGRLISATRSVHINARARGGGRPQPASPCFSTSTTMMIHTYAIGHCCFLLFLCCFVPGLDYTFLFRFPRTSSSCWLVVSTTPELPNRRPANCDR